VEFGGMRDIEGIDRVVETLRPHWDDIVAEFDRQNARFLDLANAEHDAIGRVLKAHLIVEHYVNHFLMDHLGWSERELAEAEFECHQKILLLPKEATAASFVRPGILQLNKVRNRLGHRLRFQPDWNQISAIAEVLEIARPNVNFPTPVEAIEAFAAVAAAFLSVAPIELQHIFLDAFKEVRAVAA
jgi:hypothetical protein